MLLALDQGTTSSRAILFDEHLEVRFLAQKEFRQLYPRSGWVEHDPKEIWDTQLQVARQAIESAGVPAAQVSLVAPSTQEVVPVAAHAPCPHVVCPLV